MTESSDTDSKPATSSALDEAEAELNRRFYDRTVTSVENTDTPTPTPSASNPSEAPAPKKKGKWTLIARRGNDFLWDAGNGMGLITSNSRVVPDVFLPVQSILSRGYWEPVDGSPSRI